MNSKQAGEVQGGVTGMGIKLEIMSNQEHRETEDVLLGGKDMIEE